MKYKHLSIDMKVLRCMDCLLFNKNSESCNILPFVKIPFPETKIFYACKLKNYVEKDDHYWEEDRLPVEIIKKNRKIYKNWKKEQHKYEK